MDMSQYLELFIEESKEHLQNLNQNLLLLEKSPNEMTTLNEIFRVAHTLKGIAGTMGFSKIATLTHDMENVLQTIRNGEISVTSSVVDLLFKCLDALENYLNEIINTGSEGDKNYEDIIQSLNEMIEKKGKVKEKAEKKPKEVKNEVKSEETVSVKEEKKPAQEEESLSSILIDGSLKDIIKTDPAPEKASNPEVLEEQNAAAVNRAAAKNMSAYSVNVRLNQGCLLKAARAYIVFQTLESHCEVIGSTPSIEEIEEEKFDFEFSVSVISKDSKEKIIKELNSIAEIDKVTIKELEAGSVELPLQTESKGEENDALVQKQGTAAFAIKSRAKDDAHSEQHGENKTSPVSVAKPKTGKTVRVDIDRLDTLMNLVSELIIIKTTLEGVSSTESLQNYNETIEYLERITTNLHDAVMKVRMVPVEMVFNRFPRMIRDLSKDLGKEILLNMSGETTEVDRTVIDEIGDPLIHLLRNSADHGIEEPSKREVLGKPEFGTINLRAYQDGNNVVIEVEDDGNGINIEKVRKKIIERGMASPDVAMNLSEKEVIDYLFRPSFSTADKVTDVSGRGVGLDVVKTKIEALGGIIDVETEHNKGSRFIIRLPLTLAIIQALLVVVGQEKYAVPLSSIKEIINVMPEEIKVVQKQEVYMLRNQVIPVIRLGKILDVPRYDEQTNVLTIVIVKKGDKLSGIIVNGLIGQQEIVIKSLGKYLSGLRSIAGATILGDGQVALILDVNSIA